MKRVIYTVAIMASILGALTAYVGREPSNEELCAASGGKLERSPDGRWQECVHERLEVGR